MKRVYLIRHGQTNANATNTCQGPDEPLSLLGEKQAIRLAQRVQNLSFQKIIASDYLRTCQTAEPIRKLVDVPFETNPLLREESWPSSWLGRSETDGERKQFENDLIEKANDVNWRIEDAENTHDIHTRIVQVLDLLKNDSAEEILVVSHGSFLKQLVGHVLLDGKGSHKEVASFKRTFKVTNTGISILVYQNDRWRVLAWNDHAHFAE